MTDGPIQIAALAGGADLAAVRAIYEAAFPPSERKPSAFLADAAAHGPYELLVARGGGEVLGFALVYASPHQPVSLLEYMAVARPWRGRGLGSRLFEEVLARQKGRPLLLEVEAEGGEAARRIAFYVDRGCRRIAGLGYRMPQVSERPPPPMQLLVAGCPGPALAGTRLRAWLEDILAGVYGVDAPDAAVRHMPGTGAESLDLV